MNYLAIYFCAALPLATPFSLCLLLMISQLYPDLPCFLCQESSLSLKSLPALALPLVILLVVLLLSFFCMNEPCAISSATFSFSAPTFPFLYDLFHDLEEMDFELEFELLLDNLPDLSCFSTSLSQLYTQYLQTIARLYTGHQFSLAPHEFQPTF